MNSRLFDFRHRLPFVKSTALIFSLFTFLLNVIVLGQEYPAWFLHPGSIAVKTYVGYSNPTYIIDSAVSKAYLDGKKNSIIQSGFRVKGGQGFWSTEGGNYWMGDDYEELYDTGAVSKISLAIIDTFFKDRVTMLLLANENQIPPAGIKNRERLSENTIPEWTNKIPETSGFIYSVGLSPKYYYEKSSWQEAEKSARINLAKQKRIKIMSLQKSTRDYAEEIKNTEIDITLSNIDILERWIDLKKGIFYVLMRAPVLN